MERYDEFLGFDLPEDFCIERGTNDSGDPFYSINAEKTVDDNGEETFMHFMKVDKVDLEFSPFGGEQGGHNCIINGNMDAILNVLSFETSILVFTVKMYTSFIWIKKDDHVYGFDSSRVIRDGDNEDLEKWVSFLNSVLNSVILDGTKGDFEALTVEKILSAANAAEEEAEKYSEYPVAKPKEAQHTHLDFLNKTKAGMSFLGGLVKVNETGAEYSFNPISEQAEYADSAELTSILNRIVEADKGTFDLADTAHDMAELFRVEITSFDPAHDREQEILNGLIQRASIYNTFRSFAWTLQAYCEKEGCQPVDLNIDVIEGMVDFIADKGGLNYVADSYSPAICSGDDLHNFFVPDSVPENVKNGLLKIINADVKKNTVEEWDIRSLDSLRKELDYMYPAIKAIYDELESTRDTGEALTGGVSDILYAWCSIAYAARQPIYTEDGPMNFFWEHPDDGEKWETKWRIERLESDIKRGKDWIAENSKYLSKNTPITINGKLFVFSGMGGMDEWLDIFKKFSDMGGIERGAVSGKTDYLVCNPMYAGDSKVKRAIEQRIKGKDVKIVLMDDFLKAIDYKVKTPEEQLAELKAPAKEKKTEKRIKQVVRTEVKKEENEMFTYDEHLQAEGPGYVIDIPDGFVIKKGEEGRDFIAYLPDKDAPDSYLDSGFIIYAGNKVDNDTVAQMRTVAEYTAIIKGMESAISIAFSDNKIIPTERTDLPGAVMMSSDDGCLHVNAYLGVGDHLQAMRLQINNINRKDRKRYEKAAVDIFKHMTATTPVQLLKSLDADDFVSMPLNNEKVTEWIDCIGEYVNHFSVARAIWQNSLLQSFNAQQGIVSPDLGQLKKEIRDMLRTISKYTETELKKADLVYTLKRAQYPGDIKLEEMKDAVKSLAELTNQNVNFDEEQIIAESELEKAVISRFDAPTLEAVEQILSIADDSYDKAAIEALKKAKDNPAISEEPEESESAAIEREIKQIDVEIKRCDSEIAKINAQLANFDNRDKAGRIIADKIKKDYDKIYKDYHRDITATQNRIQSSVFTGVDDPLLIRYIKMMQNTVDTYGGRAEQLVADNIRDMSIKGSTFTAASGSAIIRELIKVIDDVEGNNVSFSAIGLNLNYKFRAGSDSLKSELRKVDKEFIKDGMSESKDIGTLKKDLKDKTAECNDLKQRLNDLNDAVKYSISVDDVNKHRKYLHAQKVIKSAKHSSDLVPLKKELNEIKDYLDSKDYLEKCEVLEAEFHKKEEDAYAAELAAWNDKIKKIEEDIAAFNKNCDEEEAGLISVLKNTQNELEIEMNDELSQKRGRLKEYNEELSSLGILKFGRKKELTALIAETEKAISELENKIRKTAISSEDDITMLSIEYKNKKKKYEVDMRSKMPKKPVKR